MGASPGGLAAPRVIKAAGSADLLRFVPQLVGVDPDDSLVVVLFCGTRTNGAMRIDLLHDDDPEVLGAWATAVLGSALRVEHLDGVALVAHTPESFGADGRPPAVAALRAVRRQAERMGLAVTDLLCVAADGWGSLLDPDLPRGGRPLTDIEPEPGSGLRDEPRPVRPRTAAVVPLAGDAACAVFADHLQDWWGRPNGPGGLLHGVRLAEPGSASVRSAAIAPAMQRYRFGFGNDEVVDLIEGMLAPHDHGAPTPCPCRALLYALATRQGLENLVLVQFAWGRSFGSDLWRAAHAADANVPEIADMAEAISGGRFRRPDTARIEVAITVLLETMSYLPTDLRAPVDGMLSWLHWASGGSSAAAAYARRSLLVEPGRDVPGLVLAKVQTNTLPEWAFRADPTEPDPYAMPR